MAFAVRGEIFSVGTEKGGEARRLTETPTRESDLAWSPDGKKLAFITLRDGNPNLYVMDVATKTVRRLTATPGADTMPRSLGDFTTVHGPPCREKVPSANGYLRKTTS